MSLWSFVGMAMVLVPLIYWILESARRNGLAHLARRARDMVFAGLIGAWIAGGFLLLAGVLP